MATERGTAGHLRNGWRMAKVGFWWGLFGIVTEATGVLLRGGAGEWRERLISVPLWMLAFGVGGVLYTLFLPASVRSRPGPAAGARARTGALAGAVTGGLPAVVAALVFVPGEFAAGDLGVEAAFVGVIMVAIAALIGALIGAACGFAASFEARYGASSEGRAGMGGIGGSPRVVEPS